MTETLHALAAAMYLPLSLPIEVVLLGFLLLMLFYRHCSFSFSKIIIIYSLFFSFHAYIHTAVVELGSGVFGTCRKMLLSSTEVAVKLFNPENSSRGRVLFEAMVMTKVCKGHPNLPLFFGVYDHNPSSLPQLVSRFYSVKHESCTLHMLLSENFNKLRFTEMQWARILLGISNGIEAVHNHNFLHNDIKADNIVLSDAVPPYANSPPLAPIVIDFGKSRPISRAKKYNLTQNEKLYYRINHGHIAPELINGTHVQNVKSDVYSLGRIVCKCAKLISSQPLLRIGQCCMVTNPDFRPSLAGVYSRISEFAN